MNDRLSVIGGLRWNHDELSGTTFVPTTISADASYESVTPRLVIMYEFLPELNGYVSYTQGFKSGLTGITNTGSIPPFAPADEEQVTSYEFGLKYQNRNLQWSLAAFYYDFTNKQESIVVSTAGGGIANFVTNVGPVEIYGLDMDVNIRLTPQFDLNLGLSYLPVAQYTDHPNAVSTSLVQAANGRYLPGYGFTVAPSFDATGDRQMRAPELSANLTLNYFSGPWDASATASYISDQEFVLRTVTQDAYTMLSANGGYKFENGLRIGLFGRNLLNEEAVSFMFGTATSFITAYRPPRQIGVSLSYRL